MNEFVKSNGGFLFFKKKNWRERLWEHYQHHKRHFSAGHFRKADQGEDVRTSVLESKRKIEEAVGAECVFFSLPLYQGFKETAPVLAQAGYKAVFAGPDAPQKGDSRLPVFCRIPSFWIKFLTYF